eukprot:COSAG02_NODE_1021_length_15159_cov_24.514739_11_plen_136_part_00
MNSGASCRPRASISNAIVRLRKSFKNRRGLHAPQSIFRLSRLGSVSGSWLRIVSATAPAMGVSLRSRHASIHEYSVETVPGATATEKKLWGLRKRHLWLANAVAQQISQERPNDQRARKHGLLENADLSKLLAFK